jgi:signal peptidase I
MTVGKAIIKEIWEWIVVFVSAFTLVMFLNVTVFATTQVRQTSMKNTLIEGQHLFVEKVSYLFGNPKRGDIIIFLDDKHNINYFSKYAIFLKDVSEIFKPVEAKTNIRLVKRVVGVPGDEVNIKNGEVYIDGELLDEPYIIGQTVKREISFPVTVPDDKYFVLGDNREASRDSRSFGFIDKDQIEGKAVFRIWPINKIGVIK